MALGGLIWNNTPFDVERSPDGPNGEDRVDAWTLPFFAAAGDYSIHLTGASFVIANTSCSELTITGNGAAGTSVSFGLTGADPSALCVLAIGHAGSSSFAVGPLGTLDLDLDPGFLVATMGITDINGDASKTVMVPNGLPFDLDLDAQALTASLVTGQGPPTLTFCTSDVEAFHVGG